jgi:hypothetical protein
MHTLHYFFDWPLGQVWPNLIASAVTTIFVWVIGFRKLAKLHKRHQAELHNHITQEFAKLKESGN